MADNEEMHRTSFCFIFDRKKSPCEGCVTHTPFRILERVALRQINHGAEFAETLADWRCTFGGFLHHENSNFAEGTYRTIAPTHVRMIALAIAPPSHHQSHRAQDAIAPERDQGRTGTKERPPLL